jgi:hypothetical protein
MDLSSHASHPASRKTKSIFKKKQKIEEKVIPFKISKYAHS